VTITPDHQRDAKLSVSANYSAVSRDDCLVDRRSIANDTDSLKAVMPAPSARPAGPGTPRSLCRRCRPVASLWLEGGDAGMGVRRTAALDLDCRQAVKRRGSVSRRASAAAWGRR